MADEATLKDTVVSDPDTAEATETKVADTTPAATTPEIKILDAPDPQAIEIGQILLNSGVTKDQLNDLLESRPALESLRHSIQNNPQEFLNMLARTDPNSYEKLLETGADRFVSQYGDKDSGKAKPTGDSKTDDLVRELQILRAKTDKLESDEQNRQRAMAMASAKARYDAKVDDLFGREEIKAIGLTKSEQRNMRARLNTELSQDESIVRRISNGNFVDVSPVFKSLLQEKVEERKATEAEAKAKLDRSKKSAFPEFPAGPNPFMVEMNPDDKMFESDEATIAGFAKAYERMMGQ